MTTKTHNPIMNTLSIGSISSGTMRPEDLIPTFLFVLGTVDPERARQIKDDNADAFNDLSAQTDDIDYLLEDLFDALGEYVPSYCYFGSHPGDGADYGVWVQEDVQEQVKDDGGLIVSDLSEVHDDFCGPVLLVNDHGNATLYDADKGNLNEAWSIV